MTMLCKICGHGVQPLGHKTGNFLKRDFNFSRCDNCGFVTETDPCLDYASLYDANYYEGRRADPLVDYAHELNAPAETIRLYEWRGIVDLVRFNFGDLSGKRCLDYGCGAGGLVRYACQQGIDYVGFDTGGFTDRARAVGIPILSEVELNSKQQEFDVITMIEVIEHVPDPVALLKSVAALLAPGGLLFLTTGNVEPQAAAFFKWAYVVPEIHVSYFTPSSLVIAFDKAGLEPIKGRYGPGWSDIIRFKILKNIGMRNRSWIEALLPWFILSRLADKRYKVSAHPIGIKR